MPLPAASIFEKDGTFMNADRRVQRIRSALPPPGEARADWRIIQALAARLDHAQGFTFDSPCAIWDEVRTLWPAAAGLTYDRLERESRHWPCPDEAHLGTPILHRTHFPIGKTAELVPIDFIPTSETTDETYRLLLTTGRSLYQFNAGTMTGRTPDVQLCPIDMLDMPPADAAELGGWGFSARVQPPWRGDAAGARDRAHPTGRIVRHFPPARTVREPPHFPRARSPSTRTRIQGNRCEGGERKRAQCVDEECANCQRSCFSSHALVMSMHSLRVPMIARSWPESRVLPQRRQRKTFRSVSRCHLAEAKSRWFDERQAKRRSAVPRVALRLDPHQASKAHDS